MEGRDERRPTAHRKRKSDALLREQCSARRGVWGKIPAATYSPTRKPCSTIGSGGLNYRVRDGDGGDPSDVATGNLRICASSVSSAAAMCRARPWSYRSVKKLGEKNDQAA